MPFSLVPSIHTSLLFSYAQKNRAEWEREGKECVAAMVEKFRHVDYVQEAKEEAEAKEKTKKEAAAKKNNSRAFVSI